MYRNGDRRDAPPPAGNGVADLAVAAFGVVWTVGAATAGAPWFFCLFGVLFACVGLGRAFLSFAEAGLDDTGPPGVSRPGGRPPCPGCGNALRPGASFCPACGRRV